MTWETANPVAVVDEESNPPVVVTRYATVPEAEWFIGYLAEHGGDAIRAKVERGGYGIDAPEGEGWPGPNPYLEWAERRNS